MRLIGVADKESMICSACDLCQTFRSKERSPFNSNFSSLDASDLAILFGQQSP